VKFLQKRFEDDVYDKYIRKILKQFVKQNYWIFSRFNSN